MDCLHGFIAVAQLKQLVVRSRLHITMSRLHGFIAVAQLKPRPRV